MAEVQQRVQRYISVQRWERDGGRVGEMEAVDVCGLWEGRVMEDTLGMEELALQEIQTGSFVLEWIIHVGLENSSLCVTPSDLCVLCGNLQSF